MVPEESTVRLYHRLEDAMGKDVASVLVENFSTKQDFADLRAEIRQTFATKGELKEAVADVKASMYRALLATTLVLVSTNVALIGGAVAVLR